MEMENQMLKGLQKQCQQPSSAQIAEIGVILTCLNGLLVHFLWLKSQMPSVALDGLS